MNELSKKQNYLILFFLSSLMLITRGRHMATVSQLPDASWAIFFVIGFYFSNFLIIIAFLAQAFLIDYVVVTQMGIGQSCYTLAYVFLVPAYLSIWFSGRLLKNQFDLNIKFLKDFLIYAISGTIFCELISSGSFYFINFYEKASILEFSQRFIQFFPNSLRITLTYLVIALVFHLVITSISGIFLLINKSSKA